MYLPYSLMLFVLGVCQIGTAPSSRPRSFAGDNGSSLARRPDFEFYGAPSEFHLFSLAEPDRGAALLNLAKLKSVTSLVLFNCDLSHTSEADPLPEKLTFISISGGKLSQSSMRWLAKMPEGSVIIFTLDVRGLEFNLGHGKWITISNGSRISRDAAIHLVRSGEKVRFNQVELVDG